MGGSPSYVLAKKLRLLKEDQKKWNKEVFGILDSQKTKTFEIIHEIDNQEEE